MSKPADPNLGELDVSAARTLVVDGVRFSTDILRYFAAAPARLEAEWLLSHVSREDGSDDIQVAWSRSAFLVGRNTDPLPWEVLGLYATKDGAEARCRQAIDFVMELRIGEDLPEARETPPADRCCYPLAEVGP